MASHTANHINIPIWGVSAMVQRDPTCVRVMCASTRCTRDDNYLQQHFSNSTVRLAN